MVNHLRRRLPKCRGRVVAEGHDARIGDLLGKEVLQPECLRFRVCPGVDGIATEAVHGHDTRVRLRLVKNPEQGETTASGYSAGTH